ncbi:MAG: aminotransferase class V-fold PLP-dependent enzyme [Phycisphaerales bacterium]|nr:aminotransferase class V-fold PLP-dependent enzyme [Phycisphaerales bacterium]
MTPTTHAVATAPPSAADAIAAAVAAMGPGPLEESSLRRHVFPLFSRVLRRSEIYLANHSLGRPPDRMAEDLRRFADLWYADMDAAWADWQATIDHFRAGIARLIGTARWDCVLPKTAAGQGLRAVLNALTPRDPGGVLHVVATRGEFDAVDFILKTYTRKGRARVAWVEPDGRGVFHPEAVEKHVHALGPRLDLAVVSPVFYATGQMLQGLNRIISAAHREGGLVMLDMYHSAGVLPTEFDRSGADFAIGGSYKYTRGGPGAGWLALAPRHVEGPGALTTLDTGWFAKKGHFDFARPDEPEFAEGGNAWLEGTPPAVLAYQAKAGLDFTLAIGVGRLRNYSLTQLGRLRALLAERGVPVRDVGEHGAFVTVPARDNDGAAFAGRLKALGVNTDARLGHVRLCPDVLTTEAELRAAADAVAKAR